MPTVSQNRFIVASAPSGQSEFFVVQPDETHD
jgi:hypothetical protein